METKLSESVSDTLTNRVWDAWKNTGIVCRRMTWMELHRLAEHFLKLCKEQERDYREYDFYTLIDSNFRFEENRAEIENVLGGLESDREKAAVSKFNDYLTEEKMAEYAPPERSKIEEIEQKNTNLNKKLNGITKKMEQQQTQTLETEQIKSELQQVQDKQSQIIAKLENIDNLPQIIEALLKTKNFKPLGVALKPLDHPVKPKRRFTLPKWLKPKNWLNAFAGTVTLLIWVAATGWMLQSFSLTWAVVTGLGVFWVFSAVAYRVVMGLIS